METGNTTDRPGWLLPASLAAALYLVAGVAFGALAGSATTQQTRFAWRLAAWVVSAVAFATHIGYERLRRRSSLRATAARASLAAAAGAFALAVAANVHALRAGTGNGRLLFLALFIWPVGTAVPAFVAALVAAAGLSWVRPRDPAARGRV